MQYVSAVKFLRWIFCLVLRRFQVDYNSSALKQPPQQEHRPILGDPGAASRDDGIFMGESLQQERECPWALTLTERVPEAFEIPPSDWPEKFFSGQSAKRNSWATLMSSYTRLFSSSIAVVAWPVQREHF